MLENEQSNLLHPFGYTRLGPGQGCGSPGREEWGCECEWDWRSGEGGGWGFPTFEATPDNANNS